MGYYTTYKLTWKPVATAKPVKSCAHVEADGKNFCPVCGVKVGSAGVDQLITKHLAAKISSEEIYGIDESGQSVETVKWYEHEKPMRELSSAFPEVLFTLNGEGEESGDIWIEYFLRGKMQHCKAQIVIAPFSESELK